MLLPFSLKKDVASSYISWLVKGNTVLWIRIRIRRLRMFLNLPDPDPSLLVRIRIRILQAKLVRKPLFYFFMTLTSKNDVNVPSKSTKQKT